MARRKHVDEPDEGPVEEVEMVEAPEDDEPEEVVEAESALYDRDGNVRGIDAVAGLDPNQINPYDQVAKAQEEDLARKLAEDEELRKAEAGEDETVPEDSEAE